MAAARGTPLGLGLSDLNLDTSGGGLGVTDELADGVSSQSDDPWARFAEQLDWDQLRVAQTGAEPAPEGPVPEALPFAADPAPVPRVVATPDEPPAPVKFAAPIPARAEVEETAPGASLAAPPANLARPAAELPTEPALAPRPASGPRAQWRARAQELGLYSVFVAAPDDFRDAGHAGSAALLQVAPVLPIAASPVPAPLPSPTQPPAAAPPELVLATSQAAASAPSAVELPLGQATSQEASPASAAPISQPTAVGSALTDSAQASQGPAVPTAQPEPASATRREERIGSVPAAALPPEAVTAPQPRSGGDTWSQGPKRPEPAAPVAPPEPVGNRLLGASRSSGSLLRSLQRPAAAPPTPAPASPAPEPESRRLLGASQRTGSLLRTLQRPEAEQQQPAPGPAAPPEAKLPPRADSLVDNFLASEAGQLLRKSLQRGKALLEQFLRGRGATGEEHKTPPP